MEKIGVVFPSTCCVDGLSVRQVKQWWPKRYYSMPFKDASINFDLRTGFEDAGPPKTQTQWLDAVYGCLANKKSNFQIQIGAWFPYRTCKYIRSANELDYVAKAWIACSPLIDVLITGKPSSH